MALRDAHLAMCFAPTAPLLEEDKTCPDAFISSLVLSSLLTKAAATGDEALVVRWLDGAGNVDAVDGNG